MSERLLPQENQISPELIFHASSNFLGHFDVSINPKVEPRQFLDAIAQLDPRYQGDRELVRWELEADQTQWDDASKEVIMSTAEKMGMLKKETPLKGQFDIVISLGAANQANLDRARYATEAYENGLASYRQLILVGSSRELRSDEQKNTLNYAPGAETEFDLCVGAAKTVALENPNTPISVFYVDDEKAHTSMVVSNVLSSLRLNSSLEEGTKLAVVTTQIYRAFTQLDLARTAKQFDEITKTFTAGNPSNPNIVANRTPATYLSEILRTLRAATNYYVESK